MVRAGQVEGRVAMTGRAVRAGCMAAQAAAAGKLQGQALHIACIIVLTF